MRCLFLLIFGFFLSWSADLRAGAFIPPGDLGLRHDIQLLADAGVISGPVSSWPLAWGPLLQDIENVDAENSLPLEAQLALARLRNLAAWKTSVNEIRWRARAAAGSQAAPIRSFQATPREDGELSGGLSLIGERVSFDFNATVVENASDGEDWRPDGSHLSLALGNWSLGASTMDRWWGPAWDSAVVLSSNARPIPAITLDRNFTTPFESRWLHWLGPWDMSVLWGQLESDRAVPNARFLGIRFDFRPLRSLEIGVSRTAQWCGSGRPCGFDTFWNLMLGHDNVGGGGITADNEPGNQTAALDYRWSLAALGMPLAFYGQLMAEDEAGGFPSRYLGQFGFDGSGLLSDTWTYRWYAEYAETSCDFLKSDDIYNCAYNHGIYTDGYRYRHRTIGHSGDNDARLVTLGFVFVDNAANSWQGHARFGTLNRGGPPDVANSLTPAPRDTINVELIHNRMLRYGRLELGVGFDDFEANSAFPSSKETRAFIQWRSDY